MGSFGDRLRREREKKQMSLDDVAVTTKIGTRLLQAIEDERFEQLPGGVFNKGFVRAYAEHLGLDPDQAVADYLEASGDKPAIQPNDQELRAIAEKREKEKQHPRSASGDNSWGIVAAALLVATVGLAGWGFYSRQRVSQPVAEAASSEAAPPLPAQNSQPAQGVPPLEASASPAPENPSAGAGPSPEQAAPIPASQVMAAEMVPVPPTRESAPPRRQTRPLESATLTRASRQVSDTDAADQAAASAFALRITAREDSWLTLTVDSRIVFQGLLTQAAEKTVLANKQVVLKTGNIGALDIAFNGREIPVQGGENEVKILTFDNNGLEP